MLLYVFLGLTNQVCNYFEFFGKTYFVVENLKREYLKILNLRKLGLKLVFWKNICLILMHFFPNIQCFEEFFFKNRFIFYFFKNSVFTEFQLIQPVFRSIEIVLKNNVESLFVSINRNWFSINRKSWVRYLKNQIWLVQITFPKLFRTPFSLSDSDKHNPHFFIVFDQIFCKVFLSQGWYVLYTLSFSFIVSFTCIFSCIEGLFSNYAYFAVFDVSSLILWNWSMSFVTILLY